jgi:uncharacterized membrane protein YfcA
MTTDIPLAVVLVIVFLAALVRGAFGFGDALLAMPLLAVFIPLTVATPLMAFVGPTIALTLLARDWRRVDVRSTFRLILSTLAGIPLGLWCLKRVAARPMSLVLSVVIILFSLYNLLRPGLLKLRTDRWSWLFGFGAGVLGAAYNTNGPPVVFYGALRGWRPESFRATLQGYFLPAGGAILVGQGLAGLWTREVLLTYAWSLPVILGGVLIGLWLGRRISAHRFNRWIYVLLLLAGLVLWVKAV